MIAADGPAVKSHNVIGAGQLHGRRPVWTVCIERLVISNQQKDLLQFQRHDERGCHLRSIHGDRASQSTGNKAEKKRQRRSRRDTGIGF